MAHDIDETREALRDLVDKIRRDLERRGEWSEKYSDDQPRDEDGRFAGGGSGSSGSVPVGGEGTRTHTSASSGMETFHDSFSVNLPSAMTSQSSSKGTMTIHDSDGSKIGTITRMVATGGHNVWTGERIEYHGPSRFMAQDGSGKHLGNFSSPQRAANAIVATVRG